MNRHEPLRTIITTNTQGSPRGLLLPPPNAAHFLSHSNLEGLDPSLQEAKLRQCIEEEVNKPFDLAKDYSLRAHLIQLDALEYVLLLTFHHQASDGESTAIFARELNQAYSSFLQGQAPDWKPLPIQYSDWAARQQQTLATTIDEQITRAKVRLANAPDCLTLPLDRPRDPHRARRAAYLPITLPSELTQALNALAQRQETTVFTLLLAAYGATLSRLANQTTVVIGSPVAGRNHIETEGLIGF